MSGWNQNCCTDCWIGLHGRVREDGGYEVREPHRVASEGAWLPVRCSFCGRQTTSGIFVRADPRTVPYPADEE